MRSNVFNAPFLSFSDKCDSYNLIVAMWRASVAALS